MFLNCDTNLGIALSLSGEYMHSWKKPRQTKLEQLDDVATLNCFRVQHQPTRVITLFKPITCDGNTQQYMTYRQLLGLSTSNIASIEAAVCNAFNAIDFSNASTAIPKCFHGQFQNVNNNSKNATKSIKLGLDQQQLSNYLLNNIFLFDNIQAQSTTSKLQTTTDITKSFQYKFCNVFTNDNEQETIPFEIIKLKLTHKQLEHLIHLFKLLHFNANIFDNVVSKQNSNNIQQLVSSIASVSTMDFLNKKVYNTQFWKNYNTVLLTQSNESNTKEISNFEVVSQISEFSEAFYTNNMEFVIYADCDTEGISEIKNSFATPVTYVCAFVQLRIPIASIILHEQFNVNNNIRDITFSFGITTRGIGIIFQSDMATIYRLIANYSEYKACTDIASKPPLITACIAVVIVNIYVLIVIGNVLRSPELRKAAILLQVVLLMTLLFSKLITTCNVYWQVLLHILNALVSTASVTLRKDIIQTNNYRCIAEISSGYNWQLKSIHATATTYVLKRFRVENQGLNNNFTADQAIELCVN